MDNFLGLFLIDEPAELTMNSSDIVVKRVNNMTFDTYDDPVYFALLHVNSLLCTAFSLVAIYFILFKSPKSIGNYKWYLLNITVWSFVYDFYMTTVEMPMTLLPSPTMCSRGLLRGAGWIYGGLFGYLLFPILCGTCGMTVVWAFAYRWAILAGHERKMNSWGGIALMAFVQIFYETPTTIFYILAAYNRPRVLEAILKHYPNLASWVLHDQPCAIFAFEASPWSLMFITSFTVQFFGGFPLCFAFLTLAYRSLDAQKNIMSAKTAKMHRQMLKALVMQLLVPFCTLFVPFTLLGIFVTIEFDGPTVYKSLFIVGSLHSMANTLMMIIHIAPYRRQLLLTFRCCLPSKFLEKFSTGQPTALKTRAAVGVSSVAVVSVGRRSATNGGHMDGGGQAAAISHNNNWVVIA